VYAVARVTALAQRVKVVSFESRLGAAGGVSAWAGAPAAIEAIAASAGPRVLVINL
jgi:hypothetical protein